MVCEGGRSSAHSRSWVFFVVVGRGGAASASKQAKVMWFLGQMPSKGTPAMRKEAISVQSPETCAARTGEFSILETPRCFAFRLERRQYA